MSEGRSFSWDCGPKIPLESVEQCQETTGSHLCQEGAAWLNVAFLLQTSRRPSSSLTGLVMPRSPSARLVISSGHWGRTLQMQRSTKFWETPVKRVSALQSFGPFLRLGNTNSHSRREGRTMPQTMVCHSFLWKGMVLMGNLFKTRRVLSRDSFGVSSVQV